MPCGGLNLRAQIMIATAMMTMVVEGLSQVEEAKEVSRVEARIIKIVKFKGTKILDGGVGGRWLKPSSNSLLFLCTRPAVAAS